MPTLLAVAGIAWPSPPSDASSTDTSRNNWVLGLIAMGEGWHNNHHRYSVCARQGFTWWELELSYLALRGLQWVGLVWDIREPPRRVLVEWRR